MRQFRSVLNSKLIGRRTNHIPNLNPFLETKSIMSSILRKILDVSLCFQVFDFVKQCHINQLIRYSVTNSNHANALCYPCLLPFDSSGRRTRLA